MKYWLVGTSYKPRKQSVRQQKEGRLQRNSIERIEAEKQESIIAQQHKKLKKAGGK